MNYKITEISLKDYRAFYGEGYKINVSKGENVLIYGENGSGKSSLYRALQDFFLSSADTSHQPYKHLRASDAPNEHFVKISFKDFGDEDDTGIDIKFSNLGTDTDQADFINQSLNLINFLSYKELLKTYLINKGIEFERYFFEFVLEELLGKVINPLGSGLTLQEEWEALKKNTDNHISFLTFISTIVQGTQIEGLDTGKTFNEYLNTFLGYFNQSLQVNLVFAMDTTNPTSSAKLNFDITFFNQKLNDNLALPTKHLEIFNEARLSAFALSIYFASIKMMPPPRYKILFLDDIFIGLDMSNRLPLLEILKNEFSDYQIFMTTYDRAWFEVAKDWFAQKMRNQWKMIEMYVDNVTHAFDIPVVLETQTHIEKAEHYLAKHDYPACGMYLRKECEKVLSNLLKPAYRITDTPLDDKTRNYSSVSKKLNDMILALKDFCQEEGIDYTPFEELGIYKDAVLNPLAHNDITNPIFKEELISIISILKKLEKIRIIEIPDTRGKDLILELQANVYSVEFKPTEPILYISEPNQHLRLMNKNKNTKLSVDRNGIKTPIKQEFDTIQLLYSEACQDFGVPERHSLLDIIKKRGRTLQDLINALP